MASTAAPVATPAGKAKASTRRVKPGWARGAPAASARKNPDAYPGSIADASRVIRVLLTGTPRSPDLAQVAAALGPDEVLRRVRALA